MTIYALNKKAKFDYNILETIEAGIVLSGPEVKSIRNGNISIKSAYITFHNSEAFLINAHIGKYKQAGNIESYNPEKNRKLLLTGKQIAYLIGKMQEKGLTIVPISVYTKGRHIKLEIAVCRGKKAFDKRETIKNRDIKREIARTMRS
jgi:SsrA-binding protein